MLSLKQLLNINYDKWRSEFVRTTPLILTNFKLNLLRLEWQGFVNYDTILGGGGINLPDIYAAQQDTQSALKSEFIQHLC